jgi:hypothetical protein
VDSHITYRNRKITCLFFLSSFVFPLDSSLLCRRNGSQLHEEKGQNSNRDSDLILIEGGGGTYRDEAMGAAPPSVPFDGGTID